LVRVLLDLDRDSDAETALDTFRDHHLLMSSVATWSLGAVLAARRDARDEAMRMSDEAMAMVGPTDLLMLQGDVALDRAEILLLAGRPDKARASAADALEKYERKEYAIGIRRARAFLATLDAAPGTEPA